MQLTQSLGGKGSRCFSARVIDISAGCSGRNFCLQPKNGCEASPWALGVFFRAEFSSTMDMFRAAGSLRRQEASLACHLDALPRTSLAAKAQTQSQEEPSPRQGGKERLNGVNHELDGFTAPTASRPRFGTLLISNLASADPPATYVLLPLRVEPGSQALGCKWPSKNGGSKG